MEAFYLFLAILFCALICTLLSPVFFVTLYVQNNTLSRRCEDTNEHLSLFHNRLAEYEGNLLVWQMENKTLKRDMANIKRRLQTLENQSRTYSLRPMPPRTRSIKIQDGPSMIVTKAIG